MSNSPIFDQMVRDFQQRTGRNYADLCRPTNTPTIVNRPSFTRNPIPAYTPQDTDTVRIPRVMPLQQRNVA